MKIWAVLLLIFLSIPRLSYSLNASNFLNALETNSVEYILSKLDVSSNTSSKEILHFLQDIKKICENRFDISISLSQIQQNILDICGENISNTDCLFQIEVFLSELFDLESINTSSQFTLLISYQKQQNIFKEKDIPVNVILGCVEIGCGALLWVTPFRIIGNILIGDGCRRMLNEIESVEKARNSSHNMFQKLPSSDTIP